MDTPKVSVVIPLYNTEDYVGEALRSVLDQTLSQTEIIVVNDGSTDDSAAVVEELAARDGRLRLIHQANAGQAAARNAGLGIARGEFIYFMDSDDVLEPDTLAECYAKCTVENLDFVFFDAVSFGAPEASESWFDYHRAGHFEDRVYTGAELLDRMMRLACYRCSVCLNLIRRSFLEENGLRFHAGIIHEDELFTGILYLQARRVGRIEREFFHRRVRSCSTMTTTFSSRNVEGYLTVLRELSLYTEGCDVPTRRLLRRLTRYLLDPVLRNAWELSGVVRRRLAFTALGHYSYAVKLRSLIILLCKRPLKKLCGK